MILAGVFDRFPDLQVITGHWGEVVLFYLERIDNLAGPAKLREPVSGYFRQHVSITPSGLWSQRYFRWAMEVLGPERILFSSDYPYRFTKEGGARRFLEEAELSDAGRAAIAHGNWERMVGGDPPLDCFFHVKAWLVGAACVPHLPHFPQGPRCASGIEAVSPMNSAHTPPGCHTLSISRRASGSSRPRTSRS